MIQRLRQQLADLGGRVISNTDSEQDRLQKSLLIFASAMMGLGSMLWLVIYWAMGIKFSATVPFLYILATALSLAYYLWSLNFDVFRLVQVSLFLFVPFVMQWSIGSYVSSSGVMLWALLAPIGAILIYGARESIPWFVAYVVLATVSGVFDYYLASELPKNVSMQTIAVFFALNFVAMSTIIYLLVTYFMRQREKLQAELHEKHLLLQEDQAQIERLLLNILPAPIAKRLQASSNTIADGFSDVTVMFVDIKDFTRLSGDQPPIVIVESLNRVFSYFDGLVEKRSGKNQNHRRCLHGGGRPEFAAGLGFLGGWLEAHPRHAGHGAGNTRLHENPSAGGRYAVAAAYRLEHRAGGGRRDRHQKIHL